MDDDGAVMDYPLMRKPLEIVSWHYNTPSREFRDLFHAVLNGGRLRLSPSFPLQSWSHPGHDLLFTESGSGVIRIGERSFEANEGELIWADNNHCDIDWPSRKSAWAFFWVRVDSANFDKLSDFLGARDGPVLRVDNPKAVAACFKRMLRSLKHRPVDMDARLHADLGLVISEIFRARTSELQADNAYGGERSYDGIRQAIELLRAEFARPWRVGQVAGMVGLSEPQFYRLFRKATGSTPIDWLRHERINQAKRRLAESEDLVASIAADVGYSDPYYFSRDFKKVVGIAPRDYRNREMAKRDAQATSAQGWTKSEDSTDR